MNLTVRILIVLGIAGVGATGLASVRALQSGNTPSWVPGHQSWLGNTPRVAVTGHPAAARGAAERTARIADRASPAVSSVRLGPTAAHATPIAVTRPRFGLDVKAKRTPPRRESPRDPRGSATLRPAADILLPTVNHLQAP